MPIMFWAAEVSCVSTSDRKFFDACCDRLINNRVLEYLLWAENVHTDE